MGPARREPGSWGWRRSRRTSTERIPAIPPSRRTRFAPAPTGYLHLGHVANALWVWGAARLAGAEVLFRIEDHDRQRSRAAYDAALLEDLAWLGFAADGGPVRQTDAGAVAAYESARDELAAAGLVYACDCTRSTFGAWTRDHGRGHAWSGAGCPGGCRARALPEDAGTSLRVALGAGEEPFEDLRLGLRSGDPSETGDLAIRDRERNWTYGFTVVVDDLRQGIDLVVRGEDLLPETPRQIRLGRLLGRDAPARFLHHPLIRKPSGAKLSKSYGDSGVRELRATGWPPERVRAEAARLAAIPPAIVAEAGRS